MRILLPPSEGKRPGGRGRSLSQRPDDTPIDRVRALPLAALAELLQRPEAAEKLLLPGSVADQALLDNARVMTAATRPAVERYAGVVYEGLAVTELSAPARRRANRELLIFSGLFGVLRGGDPIPNYRVPAKAVLPEIGVVGTFWRRQLAQFMPDLLGRGPVLDLRSTDYLGLWHPGPASPLGQQLISVRILSATPAGRLAVVSYNSKRAKGRLAAAVLEAEAAGRTLTDASDIVALWLELGGRRATIDGSRVALVE